MKVFTAAFVVAVAAAAFCAPASASPYASDTTPCCFAYISRPLPRAHLQEYFYTSSKCSVPAVVFVTRKKRQVPYSPTRRRGWPMKKQLRSLTSPGHCSGTYGWNIQEGLKAQSKWRVEYSEARKGHGVEQGREVIIIDRSLVGDEGQLVPVLQMLMKSSNEAAMEAALCLGFLRPGSSTAREFLLQCLCQGPKTQQMKYHFEATQMLKTIGLEQIQAQGLEGFTFDLLRRKTYNETFLAMRQAVAETVEELKMKPTMINLVEVQLINSNATARQEAVISLLQETLILLASIDPWIQNKLKNKVFCAYEAPKVSEKAEPTRFRKEPENPNELNIQDFGLAQLKPLFVAKYSTPSDQQGRLRVQNGSAFPFTSACPPCFSPPLKDKAQATGPWAPRIRKQLQILAKTSK
ncbi:Protein HEATR9 [Manis javanica]|nr:Protein HEATR9 [Manis javanica]